MPALVTVLSGEVVSLVPYPGQGKCLALVRCLGLTSRGSQHVSPESQENPHFS